jgi:uncharacterized protein
MILDLRGFEDFPASVSLTSGPETISPFAEDVPGITQVCVDLTIQQSGDEFFCQARVVGEVSMECARCLATFPSEISGRTSFIVTTEPTRASGKESEDREEYVLMSADQVADLTDVVRQELLLALPMKPLCSEECKGLCARCGVNLNIKTCDCRVQGTDGRWEGLKNLLKDN